MCGGGFLRLVFDYGKGITKKLHTLGRMRIANPVDFIMEEQS